MANYADFARFAGRPRGRPGRPLRPQRRARPLAIRALEAGKHVLVEKPIALTTADADAMVAAAEGERQAADGRRTSCRSSPSSPSRPRRCRPGGYGALRAAHLTRVISRPDWSSGVADADRSGGPAIDLHIHDTHFVGLVCGVPQAVHSRGVVEKGAVVHLTTQYLYDDPDLAISAVSGALSQAGRPFTHGFENLPGTGDALVRVRQPGRAGARGDAAVGDLARRHGRAARAAGLGRPDGRVRRRAEVARSRRSASGTRRPPLSGELARQALVLCHAEVESVENGADRSRVDR